MTGEFLYNPPNIGSHCHCPTLMRTQTGDLLAAWYGYPDEEYRDAKLVLTRQIQDASAPRWTPSQLVLQPSVYSAGNPALFQAPDGTIYLFFVFLKGSYWNDADLQVISSNDEGLTWRPPISLHLPPGTVIRGTPLIGNQHQLLLPAYEERSKQSILLVSLPPYHSWQIQHRFEDPPLIQPTLIRDTPSFLTMYFRPTSEPKKIWRSVSPDDGKTWSTPVQTPLPNPLSGISAVSGGGATALIYNHTTEHRRYPLSLSITKDQGVTWSQPWHFEKSEFEVSYPSFIHDGIGKFHGLYTYNRRMIKYVTFSEEELPNSQ